VQRFSTFDSTDQRGGRPTLFKLVNSPIVGLTLFNVLPCWLSRWCWSASDRRIHSPDIVLLTAAATLRAGLWQLLTALVSRIRWRHT
jgi:hypothetical protein